jgi:hypothetical protein
MTLGWAIIIAVVLYLLDKHNLLKKTLKVAGLSAAAVASVLLIVIACAYEWNMWTDGWAKWQNHQLAAKYECFNSSSGAVHSVDGDAPWCPAQWEDIHERGTPLPIGDIWDREAARLGAKHECIDHISHKVHPADHPENHDGQWCDFGEEVVTSYPAPVPLSATSGSQPGVGKPIPPGGTLGPVTLDMSKSQPLTPPSSGASAQFGSTKISGPPPGITLDATPIPLPSGSPEGRKRFSNAHVLAFSEVCLQAPCEDRLEDVNFPERLSVAGLAASQDYLTVTISDGRTGYIEQKYVQLDKGCYIDSQGDLKVHCARKGATVTGR